MPDFPDELGARVRGLGQAGSYAMPGAAAARRRGDQRGRRRRALLSGTGAAVAGAVAVTAALASGTGGDESIRPPDVARDPQPAPTSQPSAPTSPSPSSPAASPSPAPTGPTSDRPLPDLLLDEAAARRAEPGDWMPGEPVQPPLLDPCAGGTSYPRDTDRTTTAATSLRTVEEGAGIDVRQTLARYTSSAAAADAAAGYERAVRGCPGAAQDSQAFEPGYQVVRSEQSGAGSTIVFRMSQGVIYASYLAVQQSGDLVSVLAVGYGGDGDPGTEAIEPFLPEVTAALTSN